MNMPKISIVTPSFNSDKYIEDCIQSVLNQNYPNFEHIIIDGGSTDGTIEILKKYPHLKWISEPDEGQSDAINKGIKLASGDILGWQNSDDYYLPSVFNKVYRVFDERIDIVFGDCIFVDEQTRFLRFKREIGYNKNLLLYYGCYIPTVSTFINLNRIKKEDLKLDTNLHNVMDYDLFLSLSDSGYKFKYVNDIWGVFRYYPNNKTLSMKLNRKKERYLVQKKYSKIKFGSDVINKIVYELLRLFYKVLHIIVKVIQGKYFDKR